MPVATLLQSLFAYKAWTNAQTFAQVAKVDAAAHGEARHLAMRILNHVYVVDRIFAAHLAGASHPYTATNTPETPELDDLRRAVAESDAWYVQYVQSAQPGMLGTAIDFTFTDGDRGRMTREEMLLHVSTHGAYHRGAVGRILREAGVETPRDLFTTHLHTAQPQRRDPVAKGP